MSKLQLLREIITEQIQIEVFKHKYLNEETSVINLSKSEAENMIRNSKPQQFIAIFKKRTNGAERVLTGRVGVTRYLKGGVLPYNAKEKGLIPVYDDKKRAYRMINVIGLRWLKLNNQIYNIK